MNKLILSVIFCRAFRSFATFFCSAMILTKPSNEEMARWFTDFPPAGTVTVATGRSRAPCLPRKSRYSERRVKTAGKSMRQESPHDTTPACSHRPSTLQANGPPLSPCNTNENVTDANKLFVICPGSFATEALKGHRVLWKIEICYLIRMT